MYITVIKSKGKNKTYQSVLLRESYREGGRVKNRTTANLSRCRPEEIEAIRLALKHKDDLSGLEQVRPGLEVREGPSLGALWTVYALARRLGVDEEYLAEIAELDGYALKTDLPTKAAGVRRPKALPGGNIRAVTRKRLPPTGKTPEFTE